MNVVLTFNRVSVKQKLECTLLMSIPDYKFSIFNFHNVALKHALSNNACYDSLSFPIQVAKLFTYYTQMTTKTHHTRHHHVHQKLKSEVN